MDFIMDVTKDSEEPEWLEKNVVGDLRLWQIMFLCLAGVTSLIVMVCCCFRFRIPRTKQQIEADYQRRKITSKFRQQLETIQDSKMDAMSLKDGDFTLESNHKIRDCIHVFCLALSYYCTCITCRIILPRKPWNFCTRRRKTWREITSKDRSIAPSCRRSKVPLTHRFSRREVRSQSLKFRGLILLSSQLKWPICPNWARLNHLRRRHRQIIR
uniref:Transmembrane inner ear expressed protein n=1 Tax=Pectinophora gossypiella TaxID=13191 RepID=A0A1E1WQZ2_PECGO